MKKLILFDLDGTLAESKSPQNDPETKTNNMTENNLTVAIYNSRAEAAIKELQHSSFGNQKLSIIGREYHTDEHLLSDHNADNLMKSWGKTGAFWGGISGWLFGSVFFFIPGTGPMLFAGPFVVCLIGALKGAVIVGGMSALGALFTAAQLKQVPAYK